MPELKCRFILAAVVAKTTTLPPAKAITLARAAGYYLVGHVGVDPKKKALVDIDIQQKKSGELFKDVVDNFTIVVTGMTLVDEKKPNNSSNKLSETDHASIGYMVQIGVGSSRFLEALVRKTIPEDADGFLPRDSMLKGVAKAKHSDVVILDFTMVDGAIENPYFFKTDMKTLQVAVEKNKAS
jgi:nitrogen regulatory protein PII-like uncharacterized protein